MLKEEGPKVNVLIGFDGTQSSITALRYVLEHFFSKGSTVTIVHARQRPFVMAGYDVAPMMADERKVEETAALARLICEEFGVAASFRAGEGLATEVILDAASSLKADLIVVGAHNRGSVERMILGSVSEQVVRKARCPVLVVR